MSMGHLRTQGRLWEGVLNLDDEGHLENTDQAENPSDGLHCANVETMSRPFLERESSQMCGHSLILGDTTQEAHRMGSHPRPLVDD